MCGSIGIDTSSEVTKASDASKAQMVKCVERTLMIAERYIVAVEENQTMTRALLPHFLTFKSENFVFA